MKRRTFLHAAAAFFVSSPLIGRYLRPKELGPTVRGATRELPADVSQELDLLEQAGYGRDGARTLAYFHCVSTRALQNPGKPSSFLVVDSKTHEHLGYFEVVWRPEPFYFCRDCKKGAAK